MRPLTAGELRGNWATQQWYDVMLRDPQAAQRQGPRIQSFIREQISPYLAEGFSNQAVDKLLASVGDWAALTLRLRWPYQSIDAAEANRLRPVARDLLPEFFAKLSEPVSPFGRLHAKNSPQN